jgi:hypothetical protein
MAYLVDGEGDIWVPSGSYMPNGEILWQLQALVTVTGNTSRTMWIPNCAETISRRYGGAKIYGVGPTGTIGHAQSHSAG